MRKDVILGMSIGGVMLAVVIVYLTVSPSGKHNKHVVQLDNGGGVVEGAGGPTADLPDTGGAADSHAPDVKPADSNTDKPAAPAAPKVAEEPAPKKPTILSPSAEEKNDPRWGPLLWSHRTPLMGVTETPGGSAGTGAGESAGDQKSTIAPPGTIPGGDVNPPVADGGSTEVPFPVPPTPTTRPAGNKVTTHKIAPGETFSTIAASYYGSANFYPHIQRANPTLDPSRLRVGMTINLPDRDTVIPPEKPAVADRSPTTREAQPASHRTEAMIDATKEYRVVARDSLHKIALKLYGNVDMVNKIYELNKATIGDDPAKLKLGTILKLPSPPTVKQ